uniref:HMG box domain-containing protein n=1 Tax=Alexandrium catenella TaxID=2925 RepID=A0A7S1WEU3_ALECA|mmetsp:Transcript_55058/g.147421  ORF Transcript_55058/g.147421 Transcript_55058/m.147421 type:complete len:1221 (+) Transcript_55058:71-3733(+)
MAEFAATQAYPDEAMATQAYPEGQNGENGQAQAAEPEKKKRGKPKDELAPPRPKNAFQRVTGEARKKIKEERPEIATDLKAMGLALKEVWEKTPEEEKERMTKEYGEEMAIWKPKWAEYKLTPHYKEFFEVKQDWVDARMRKKLIKKLNKDAPKKPKSGYMLFAGEIRERVSKEVMEAGGGMGDIGKKISEEWGAVSEEKKAELANTSAGMKKKYDIDFAAYKETADWANFCDERAKLENKQIQKKLIRTRLDEAPKKPASSYAIFRSEVMPKVTEENKGLGCGELGKKIASMWAEVSAEKKEEYAAQSAKFKAQYEKDLVEFKRKNVYTSFLMERQVAKAKENKLLKLRTLPKRPMSAFAMFALEHKNDVEPGKGEGKGRDALKKLYEKAREEEKAAFIEKEKELKIKFMEDTQAFKEGEKFLEFKNVEKKIKMEFMNEATKVLTLRFLSDAPKEPPKSPFAVFVAQKRKASGEADGPPKSKKERAEEITKLKEEWAKADLQTKYDCEVQKKELAAKWKDDCKEFMADETWKEYLAECKKLKVPVQSILKEKKKILRKLKNGMAILPLPSKPESCPAKPPSAIRMFARDKLGEIKDKAEIPKLWTELDDESKQKYQSEAEEKGKAYRQQIQEFQSSEEGKLYIRQLKSTARRNKLAKAKDAFLTDLPKKPASALKNFISKNSKSLKIKNPQVKGADFKKLVMDKWENLDEDEKAKFTDAARAEMEAYDKKMEEFKASENWASFKKAIKVKAKRKMQKAKGMGFSLPAPKKPEGLPPKPLDAFKAYCKEMAGQGKALGDLAKMFKELPEESQQERRKQFQEQMDEYQQKTAEFDKTPDGRKYSAACASYAKRKRLVLAKIKFLKDEPKRPANAFSLFCVAKRPEIATEFPDLKGLGPVQGKLGEMWKDLSAEDRAEWTEKEFKAKEEYDEKLAEFQKTPEYKKYSAIVSRLTKKPGVKKAQKKTGVALPPAPSNLPKKPASGFFLYLSSQKAAGNSVNIAKGTESWRELGAEGQKKYQDEAAALLVQYEKDMKEFTKSVDGKKYLRLRAAADKKGRLMKAKTRFLGSDDAPKEPKRPPSAYFIFVQETRSTLPSGKISEVAKQLTELWNNQTAEQKQAFQEKAAALKEQYDKDMAEYKNSANFKKYDKAIKNINKKRGAKPKAAVKAAKAAKAGRGRGGGGGRGRGGKAAPPSKAAGSDSDSDVMGSDEDDSSSSDSDSD